MIVDQYKKTFAELLAAKIGMTADDIVPLIETPPQSEMGDLAFPCFSLAKALKKAPPMIAAELAEGLKGQGMEIKAMGPYINVFIEKALFIEQTLRPDVSGHLLFTKEASKAKVLLEYMSGNPNKPLHVGHARNVCLGDALRRIFAKQ